MWSTLTLVKISFTKYLQILLIPCRRFSQSAVFPGPHNAPLFLYTPELISTGIPISHFSTPSEDPGNTSSWFVEQSVINVQINCRTSFSSQCLFSFSSRSNGCKCFCWLSFLIEIRYSYQYNSMQHERNVSLSLTQHDVAFVKCAFYYKVGIRQNMCGLQDWHMNKYADSVWFKDASMAKFAHKADDSQICPRHRRRQ